MSKTHEMTVTELERLVAPETRRRREAAEDRDGLELADELERFAADQAADRVDELIWHDELTRFPLYGMRSPRYRSPEERDYADWFRSEAGARTRRIQRPYEDD